ncbi:sensor histidine kinase [Paenibacillus sp. KN14-4R]|uniref:sensor histidine kinase n=1 Tax=Paenibacillus sp. KN14-4R TaxID=3445773 RepID=UPI003F9F5DA2
MSLRMMKLLTMLLPPLLIGGFEYIRHEFLLNYLSMEAGNFFMTLLTLVLSFVFATWMFRSIEASRIKLAEEQSKRAVYEERERLARELHDNLAQTLFFLNVKLKQGQLDDAKEAVSDIDNHLRQAIFNLRTPPEEGTSFVERLQKWLRDWEKLTEIELTSTIQVLDGQFTRSEEVNLFGIIQEAFTNIRKHSLAESATIELQVDSNSWNLMIYDDGKGIADANEQHMKYGISLMRKRAHELGATMELQPDPLGGTRLTMISTRRKTP